VSDKDAFDPEALKASEDLIANQRKAAAPKPRYERQQGRFVMVPFEELPTFCLQDRLWLRLLYLAWYNRSSTVLLTNQSLVEWGINRKQKYKALRILEQAGRVSVERRGNKNPRVTLHLGRSPKGRH